jgi:hypothetical protein
MDHAFREAFDSDLEEIAENNTREEYKEYRSLTRYTLKMWTLSLICQVVDMYRENH